MKAIITTICMLICLMMTACKSKKTLKQTEIITAKEQKILKKDSTKHEQKSEEIKNVQKKTVSEKQKNSQTEIDIKGKAEPDKPLAFHEVKNGDTLQSITVIGTAEVYIRQRNSNSETSAKEFSKKSSINKLENFSRNLVNEEKLKETGQEIKIKAKEVTTKTGTFWSFGLIAIFGVMALLIIGIIIYFKK